MTNSFIVFEGVDGSGKSGVSAAVAEKIGALHLESPIEPFKNIRRSVDDYLDDKGRFLFYLTSNIFLSKYINENISRKSIVCARYFHSTIIGYASRLNLEIADVYKLAPIKSSELLFPTVTIFLHVNENTQRDRINLRGQNNSRADYKCLEDAQYRQRLFDKYLRVAEREKWISIDTSHISFDEVVLKCVELVNLK